MTTTAEIHPSALIDDAADIHPSCHIGPGTIVGPEVSLAEDVELGARVILEGPVTVGSGTRIAHGAIIGGLAQDFKVTADSPSAGVRIGSGVWIKELAIVHRATSPDTPTDIGDGVFVMSQAHVGHDCRLDEGSMLTTLAALGGHVHVGAKAIIGGGTLVHQHCRVGRLAMITGGIGLPREVPPFVVVGARNTMHGLNLIGLRRSGMRREDISALRRAYREFLHVSRSREEVVSGLRAIAAEGFEPVGELADYYATGSRPVVDGVGTPPNQFRRWLSSFGLITLREGEADDTDG
ncbi:MAG: acyl-ACP--UDP-N-acetylglucosamine O-acyltransferase [Planctomycetota bacterium]